MPESSGLVLTRVHRTAINAAAMRAAHVLWDAPPHIFEDPFALPLTGLTAQEVLAWAAPGKTLNSRTIWSLRSRYAEDRLAAARRRVTQYVVLGAGLDSFALRAAGRLDRLRVFEVDDPPLQAWKRERIAQLGLTPPPELSFVPCNFELTTLADALAAAGFNEKAPTFISWLGVTQYLTMTAIEGTLRWVASLTRGSEIVFSYVPAGEKAEALGWQMAARGVPLVTVLSPAEITRGLLGLGFKSVEHLTEGQATQAYFQNRADGLTFPDLELLATGVV